VAAGTAEDVGGVDCNHLPFTALSFNLTTELVQRPVAKHVGDP